MHSLVLQRSRLRRLNQNPTDHDSVDAEPGRDHGRLQQGDAAEQRPFARRFHLLDGGVLYT
jgi:hypothetical protein